MYTPSARAKAGGYARIATLFKKARQENPGAVIALDNGDTIHGTFLAVNSKGEALVPILNALAFDGMTAHWEFAYGPDHFKSIVEKLDFPMLAINCYYKETDKLVFPPFQIVERDGLSIGVIGIAATIVDKTTYTKRIAGDILIQIDQKLSTNNVMEQSVETLINVCC